MNAITLRQLITLPWIFYVLGIASALAFTSFFNARDGLTLVAICNGKKFLQPHLAGHWKGNSFQVSQIKLTQQYPGDSLILR